MNLSIKHVLQEMAHEIPNYANSLMHKAFTWIGGGSAAYQLSDGLHEYIPDFALPIFNWLWQIDWLQVFSTYAVLALCVERSFVIWVWHKRVKRGDYDEGKPQELQK